MRAERKTKLAVCGVCHTATRQQPIDGPDTYTCQACRRAAKTYTCLTCGATFHDSRAVRKYCSIPCASADTAVTRKGQSKYGDTHQRTVRRYREQDAPGLTRAQRERLLRRWKKQGRACTYCLSPATTIDHVVPLNRGGTHWEGNLTPACKPCNSGKQHCYVTEWKHSKRAPLAQPQGRTTPKLRAKKVKLGKYCQVCGRPLPAGRRVACGNECALERFNTRARNEYRDRVGIPRETPLHKRVR